MGGMTEEPGIRFNPHRKTFDLFGARDNNTSPADQSISPVCEIFNEKDCFQVKNRGGYRQFLETCTKNIVRLLEASTLFPAQKWQIQINANSELYTALFACWQETIFFLSPINGSKGRSKQYPFTCMQNYGEVIEKYLQARLPVHIQEWIAVPKKMAAVYEWTLSKYFSLWYQLSGEMKKKYSRALCGDREAYKSFLQLWYRAQYMNGNGFKNSAYSPLMPDRQRFEKLFDSINAYIRFVANVDRVIVIIYGVAHKTMEKLIDEMSFRIGGDHAMTDFVLFSRLWWEANEQAFNFYFQSKKFKSLVEESSVLWYLLKERYEELMDDIFEEISSCRVRPYQNITG
ncbi:MAG: hypothetical protein GX887_08705 [Firmicutes bacterium]|nr:hypothetical protein [Bacillota bacterium]